MRRSDAAAALELAALALADRAVHPLAQVVDQPAAGAADFAAALVHDMDAEFDPVAFGGHEPLQPARLDMVGDHVQRHVAPAKAREQKFEPRRQIGEAPDVMADDAAGIVLGQRRAVGEDELHMRLERLPCDRFRGACQGMVDGDDGNERDLGQEIRGEVARAGGDDRIDRKADDALAQPLFGAAQPLGEDGDRHLRELFAQRLEARHQQGVRKGRIDRERQLGFDVAHDARRARLHRAGAVDQALGVLEDHRPRAGEARRFPGAIEERHAQDRLERVDGLADRRLDAPEPPRGGREAAGFRDREENPHLVEG
jgi:hypothetical protein